MRSLSLSILMLVLAQLVASASLLNTQTGEAPIKWVKYVDIHACGGVISCMA